MSQIQSRDFENLVQILPEEVEDTCLFFPGLRWGQGVGFDSLVGFFLEPELFLRWLCRVCQPIWPSVCGTDILPGEWSLCDQET